MDRYTIYVADGLGTVEGRYKGTGVIVKRTSKYLVLRFAGRKVFAGQGQPRRWGPASYEVFAIESTENGDDGRECVNVLRLFDFSAVAHTWPEQYR